MSKEKLIIFDCDGVLVDSEDIANTTFAGLVRKLGHPLSDEEAIHVFPGTNLQACVDYVQDKFSIKLPDDIALMYRKASSEAFRKNLKPVEGIETTLSKINNQKCVASNGPHQKIVENLKITSLTSHFGDRIYSAYTIQKWKPNPALFTWVAQSMDYEPKDCIVVEDSVHGVIAAQKAGIKVLAYLNKNRHHVDEIKENGGVVFEDMEELVELIR
jgi:HAD superfamily hydrolase (TIGR01509 family)